MTIEAAEEAERLARKRKIQEAAFAGRLPPELEARYCITKIALSANGQRIALSANQTHAAYKAYDRVTQQQVFIKHYEQRCTNEVMRELENATKIPDLPALSMGRPLDWTAEPVSGMPAAM